MSMLVSPQSLTSNSSECVVSSCPSSPSHEIDVHSYDYLIVIDFEATCDNGDNPSISLSNNNQEMIEFPFVVIKLLDASETDFNHSNFVQIMHQEQNYVKPEYSTHLTQFCTDLTGITDETIAQYGKPLRKVIQAFDTYIQQYMKDKRFCIITDGEWDLKQLLIRESKNKQIPLMSHYYTFFDLRKEYRKCFPFAHVRGLLAMIEHSGITHAGRHHSGIDDCFTIVELVNVLLKNGHKFKYPCIIDEYYDPFRDCSFSNFRQSPPPSAVSYMPVYYNDSVYNSYQNKNDPRTYNTWSYPPLTKSCSKKAKKSKKSSKRACNRNMDVIPRSITVSERQ